MKSPFGIIGETELQNIDRKTPSASGQGAGGSFEQPTSPASEQGTNAAGGGYQMGRFEVKVKK